MSAAAGTSTPAPDTSAFDRHAGRDPSPGSAACTRCQVHTESTFRIDGLHCRDEVTILERRLGPVKGLEDLATDVVGGRMHVKYDAAVLSAAAITDAVAETGMQAWLEHEAPVARPSSRLRDGLLVISGAGLVMGMATGLTGLSPAWHVGPYLVATLAGAALPAVKAVSALRRRVLDINVLMVIAVVGAMALGEWAEAASVVFLFCLAQWLEVRSMERARAAIRELMTLAPTEARIRVNGGEQRCAVESVAPGSTMIVRPGEKIPLDGRISAGRSEINQAPITGESLPIDKTPGDEVFAGTINGHGALQVEVTRYSRDTTLSRIVHLVESAQATRARTEQFIDRFARWYTPAVVALAILITTIPPLALGEPWAEWFYRSLVLLVIACPCALVIATPVSIVSALAAAARHGVLIKGGTHLERLATVRAIAFDKTGTLTKGALKVVRVHPLGASRDELLTAAASVESQSEHPIAAAIVRAAQEARLPLQPVAHVRALPGLGAQGSISGSAIVCGSPRLFRDQGWMTAELEHVTSELVADGASPVLVARDGQPLGALALADQVRESSAGVVADLRRQGVDRLVMLTGDQESVARAVGARVGIDDVRATLLPEDKVAAIRALRASHGATAMIGDGVNDAPALAAADVGIAMGAMGSAAALETADVALMSDDLGKLPFAIRLSRAAVRTIRTNIALALASKAIFLALAMAGVATLWMAVIADTGTSLLVVANALRLRRQG